MVIDTRSGRLRMSLLGAVAVALFAALFARVWFLQVLNEQEFVQLADGNQVRQVVELAPRGRIIDVNGKTIVDNRPSIVISIDRETIVKNVSDEDLDDLFFRLAQEISATGQLTKVAELRTAFESERFGPFAEVPVARDVSEDLQLYLAERSHEFPGVNSSVVMVRTYPYGDLAAHILGYVGALNEEEWLATRDKPKQYQENDFIGKTGIELFYEDALRGTPGFRTIKVDRFSNVIEELEASEPVAGSDVHLTIDVDLQRLTEDELKRGLEFARTQEDKKQEGEGIVVYNAPAGAVVILDPRDGSVRAMASFPTYDPALFVNGISAEAFAALTDEEADLPLLNRAIQGEYAPGSTFKPFTTYAALDTGLLGSRGILGVFTEYSDEGWYRIPNCGDSTCVFTNAASKPLGQVDLRLALTLSSDVYFYNLAANFDRLAFDTDSIQQAAVLFGYGSPTGVTLPGELAGRMPTPATRLADNEANPEAFPNSRWGTGDTLNTAIGQGDVLATPLQIANAYSVIANGGTLYAPNLARTIVDPITQEAELSFGPRILRQLYWPTLIRDPIWDGLKGVTNYQDELGFAEGTTRNATARKSFEGFPLDDWPVAGKTGTSEKFSADGPIADYALFVGYGPLPNPEYVAVALLEEAGFGGDYAAPVIRNIFQRIAEGTVPEVLTQEDQDLRAALQAVLFEEAQQAAGAATETTDNGSGSDASVDGEAAG